MTTALPTRPSRPTRPARPARSARSARRRSVAGVAASSGVIAVLAASLVVAAGAGNRASAADSAPQGQAALCRPWQTSVTVPPGTVLTPRVFPTAEPPAAPRPTTTTPVTKPGTKPGTKPVTKPKPAPRPRVVCRNAAPTPFAQPAWDPDSVVGGARLAAHGVVVDAEPGTPMPPAVYDVSYVVADLTSGEVLAAKSAHAWLRPASTLKTLTALTLLPLLDPHRVVVASEDAQAAAGTRVGILAGNRYPVANLVDAMLMFSANDAVYALADAAGGYDHTVELMNARAREVGAFDTLVVDPSGLDDGDQRSSAYDLAVIARDAMRLPEFRTAVVKRDAVFPGGRDASGKVWKPFHVYNINDLLRHYPGAIGVKPGRTDRAQHTFIGAATRGGRTLLVAQMGSVTGSWKPTAALLDWGFANADRVTPVGRLVDPGEAAPPVAAPALTPLRSATADAGSASGRAPSTPAPVAGTRVPGSDPGSLAVLGGVGLLVTAGVVGIGVAVRRRRART